MNTSRALAEPRGTLWSCPLFWRQKSTNYENNKQGFAIFYMWLTTSQV